MTTTPEITRSIRIDMGHRLLKHESKCKNCHGHSYMIELSCRGAAGLDEVGRVIDFGVIKEIFGKWLNEVFDHGFAIEVGDPIADFFEVHAQKHVVLDVPPTAENLARLWFDGAVKLLATAPVIVTRIRVYETPNCWADYP